MSDEQCPICGDIDPEGYTMQTIDAEDKLIGPKRWYCRSCGERIDDWYPIPEWVSRLIEAEQ